MTEINGINNMSRNLSKKKKKKVFVCCIISSLFTCRLYRSRFPVQVIGWSQWLSVRIGDHADICAVGAIMVRIPPRGTASPTFPERVKSTGEPIRDFAHHSRKSLGPFIKSDVILQLCRRHLDVPSVPKHPPD